MARRINCFEGTFFYRGIHLLPNKWEKVITSENILIENILNKI